MYIYIYRDGGGGGGYREQLNLSSLLNGQLLSCSTLIGTPPPLVFHSAVSLFRFVVVATATAVAAAAAAFSLAQAGRRDDRVAGHSAAAAGAVRERRKKKKFIKIVFNKSGVYGAARTLYTYL